MEYCSAIKKEENMPFSNIFYNYGAGEEWGVILSDPKEEHICYMSSLIQYNIFEKSTVMDNIW